MRAALLVISVFILACSTGGGGGGGGRGGGPGGDKEEPVVDPRILVEAEPAVLGGVGDSVVASAAVESNAQANLMAETSGLVTAVYVEEGDVVRKGQVLAILASPSLDAGYERAGAELDRAKADATAAERLFAQGAIARSELDTSQRALAAARTAHLEASQTRGFTRIESPIDGVVAARNVRYGETASPGTPAFTVVDLDQLRVVVALPERDLARVAVGQSAKVVSAYDEKVSATGKVVRVAPVVDTQTGTVRVTVALDPGQTTLRPGQYSTVRIEVARHDNVVVVPRRAVVWEEGQSYVFKLVEGPAPEEPGKEKDGKGEGKDKSEDGGGDFGWLEKMFGGEEEKKEEEEIPGPYRRADRMAVKLGFEDGTTAELTEGVAAGDVVITVGNQALRDDARVRLPDDPKMPDPEEKKDDAAAKSADPAAEG